MASGEPLSDADRLALDHTIRKAEQACRFEFSVYVGPVEGDDARDFATRLHHRLVAPDRSVLVLVDPGRRLTEIVTGSDVRRRLTDAEVELALLDMQDCFAQGELATGLTRGIGMLAQHARRE